MGLNIVELQGSTLLSCGRGLVTQPSDGTIVARVRLGSPDSKDGESKERVIPGNHNREMCYRSMDGDSSDIDQDADEKSW
jgi:hypothetical protein